MNKIETQIPYNLESYELVAYEIAKYFVKFDCKTSVAQEIKDESYTITIKKKGLINNLAGTVATVRVMISKLNSSSLIKIWDEPFSENILKESLTFLLILPTIKKYSDIISLRKLAKDQSLKICHKYKIKESK